MMPAFRRACMYVLNALASVWKSPRTSDGAAFANAWKSLTSLAIRDSALPDVVWSAWANFAPRAMSCAQFFEVANVGAVEGVAAVAVDVAAVVGDDAVVVGDADFLLDPPQPAAITTQTRASADMSFHPIAEPESNSLHAYAHRSKFRLHFPRAT